MSTTTASASEVELVSLDDIEAAARGLSGVATRTPLLPFDAIARIIQSLSLTCLNLPGPGPDFNSPRLGLLSAHRSA